MKKALIAVIAVVVIVIALFASTYNGLVTKSENVKEKESSIDVQLKRRADLIPNLINTVKGYMKHEQSVIDSVTSAREKMVNANNVGDKINANNELTTALNNLYVVVENYPDLKASSNFTQLQDELAGTENRIATARRDYNSVVKEYNEAIKKFPTNLIAGMFGFDEKEYYEAEESAKDVPKVSFE